MPKGYHKLVAMEPLRSIDDPREAFDDALQRHGIVRRWWSYGERYIGARQALIDVGLAKSDQFPGEPGRNKTSVTIRHPEYVQISIFNAKRGTFSVCRKLPKEQLEERNRRYEQEENVRQLGYRNEKFVNSWPKSADAYRERVDAAIRHLQTMLIAGAGYEFDKDTIATIEDAIAEIRCAVMHGQIGYDARWRPLVMQKLRSEVAAADTSFQSFVATVCASAQG